MDRPVASPQAELARAPFTNILASIFHLNARFQQRHHLAQLDDHLLRDIGLTRAQANALAAQEPWDGMPHWQT